MIFAENIGSREIIGERAEKLIDAFRKMCWHNAPEYHPTCSIGIAFCPQDGKDFETLYRISDSALYRAKSRGKNQFAISEEA